MSAPTMTETVGTVSPMAGPPPIAILLPLLKSVLDGSSLLFRLGLRFLLAMVFPLRILWFIIRALLSPVFIPIKVALDLALFTPFSIIRMVAVALYPVYVFCMTACIVGAVVGIFGQYVSTAILGALARSKYVAQPPSASSVVTPPTLQAMLRKRKRRSVRLQ